MPVYRFDRASLRARPWKNGGGVTHEVMCLPQGSSLVHFDWRVSIARITASGPFSTFAGVDRVITLLEGPGVHLRAGDGTIDHRLDRPLEPYAFPGEAAVQAELLGTACEDLNVMTRRGACSAGVQVAREPLTLPLTSQGLLFAARGRWALQGGQPAGLAAGEGLWWHDAGRAWALHPLDTNAALVAVLIETAAT